MEVRKQLDSAKDTVTLRPLNTESERQQNFVLHKRLVSLKICIIIDSFVLHKRLVSSISAKSLLVYFIADSEIL